MFAALVRMRIARNTLWAITGIITLSSSCPCSRRDRHRRVAAHHLEADLVHHLGDRRVHLARHDRRSRLHRRQRDLVDARCAGPDASSRRSLGDLAQVDRKRAQRAAERRRCRPCSASAECGRRRRAASRPVICAQVLDHQRRVLRLDVHAGADRGAADAQIAQIVGGLVDAPACRARSCRP